jgi:hypothetical protein
MTIKQFELCYGVLFIATLVAGVVLMIWVSK